jgi:hypothetical protein
MECQIKCSNMGSNFSSSSSFSTPRFLCVGNTESDQVSHWMRSSKVKLLERSRRCRGARDVKVEQNKPLQKKRIKNFGFQIILPRWLFDNLRIIVAYVESPVEYMQRLRIRIMNQCSWWGWSGLRSPFPPKWLDLQKDFADSGIDKQCRKFSANWR